MRARRYVLSMLVAGIVGWLAGSTTYAAFTATSGNGGNTFDAGTVYISDNDSGGAVVTLTNARIGDSSTGCIKITYGGSLASDVHIYGSATGTLPQYVNLKVTRGTNTSAFNSCAGFTPDGGGGVLYDGDLSAFPSTYGTGVVDPSTWTTNDTHDFKIAVTLKNGATAAEGLSSTASFTWEARNQ